MLLLPNNMRFVLPSLAVLLLAMGCASPPPLSPPVARVIPPLSPLAKMPPTPPECLPTCLQMWSESVAQWQRRLTSAASPSTPASAPTKP